MTRLALRWHPPILVANATAPESSQLWHYGDVASSADPPNSPGFAVPGGPSPPDSRKGTAQHRPGPGPHQAGHVAPPQAPGRSGSPQAGRRLADRYRLDAVIGRGSMGTVWEATDEVLHRLVAIKEIDLPPGMPAAEISALRQRTLREARAVAALSNPYVITLFDILILNTGPVIVMELLRARSLAQVIRQVGRLPDGQAATIGVAVASGLLAAHAAGITHRDVKPGNVLICDDGRIKLTDFGIARSTGEQTMTATGLLLGSPAYIAPEVANGVAAGPISDAWGLGGMLFACTEGRPPFDQGTAIATLTSVVKDPVPPHPHSGRLGGVVSGLLVKTPHLRMRIDRALTIMRGVADDPSGTNLSIIGHIPRDPSTSAGPPVTGTANPPPGASGHRGTGTAQPMLGGRPPSWSPGPGQGRPVIGEANAPAGAGTAGPGPWPRHTAPAGPPSRYSASQHAPAQPGAAQPGAARYAAPQPQPYQPLQHQPPQHQPLQPQPPRHQPALYQPALYQPALYQPEHQALPPPPWARDASASLMPLPETAEPVAQRWRIPAAILVALLAAAAGFFGVRLIAGIAGSADPDPGSTSGSALTGSPPGEAGSAASAEHQAVWSIRVAAPGWP